MVRLWVLLLPVLISACSPGQDNSTYNSLSDTDKAKFAKYLILGRELYSQNCQNCHQANGRGLRGLIPPLAGAGFLQQNQSLIPCLLRFGTKDTISVNGTKYAPQMPRHKLTNLELAEVITYINNSWGNEYGFVEVKQVDAWLKNCR